MKTTERKKELSKALEYGGSVSLTDEDRQIMERYKLDPDHKVWTIAPIYDVSGRIKITAKERQIIDALAEKLKVKNLIYFKFHGDE